MKADILLALRKAKVTAIVRGLKGEKLRKVADALVEGGISAIEVTFDTPGAADMIKVLKAEYSDKMIVGAGTVLDCATCRTAILSGADFILSPTLNVDVIIMCNRYGKVCVPGVMTPTEILTAVEHGADMVKVFPAGTLGPRYIKDVLGPLKQVSVMAVGGVNLNNAQEFIKMGAETVGIASDLVNAALVEADDYASITQRAKTFVELVNK